MTRRMIGMVRASNIDIVVTIRRKTWTLAIMAALVFAAATTPIAAASAQQRRCPAQGHDCGTMNPVVSCCCIVQHDSSQPATVDTGTQRAPAPAMALAGPIVPAVVPALLRAQVHASALRRSPPDLLTLYATLLI